VWPCSAHSVSARAPSHGGYFGWEVRGSNLIAQIGDEHLFPHVAPDALVQQEQHGTVEIYRLREELLSILIKQNALHRGGGLTS